MSLEYPETMQEFLDRFGTDKACRLYLAQVRWPDGFACPSCAHTAYWEQRRGIFRCRHCHRDVSLTAGTMFARSHLPLRLWFQALWLVVSQKNGVSALGLSHALGITRQKTGWSLLSRIRSAMVRPGRERLSGTVEVDEIFIGGLEKGAKGRGGHKAIVLVAVEDKEGEMGRIRLTVIPNASHLCIMRALKDMVALGSIIRTDGWQGYAGLKKAGYGHVVIEKHKAADKENLTPLVHRVSSLLKRWLLGTLQGGIQKSHLSSYLDEFVFRFNRRSSRSRGKLFFRLVQQMVVTPPHA